MTKLRKPLLLALGFVFVGLGGLGAVVPVLPTTPLLILALWCFARSSERFHSWLYNHRLFGPPLQAWERHRVIPPLAKIAAVGSMLASVGYVCLFSTAPWYAIAAMIAFIVYAMWYILSKPSFPPPPTDAGSV